MDISNTLSNAYLVNRPETRSPQQGVNEVSATEATVARDIQTQDRALREQNDIVNSLQSNARSLQASGERVGTRIDVQA